MMNAKSCFLPVLSAVLLAGVTGSQTYAQFTPLLQRVPGSANTIFLLNAEKVFSSELAQKQGWQKDFAKSIEQGLVHLPADTSTMCWRVKSISIPRSQSGRSAQSRPRTSTTWS